MCNPNLHSDSNSPSFRCGRRSFLAGLALTGMAGCKSFVNRSQSPDELSKSFTNDLKKAKAGYIAELCNFHGANYAKVEGIALAFGLADTGSNPKPGAQRDQLVRDLTNDKLDINIEKLLAGKDTEMVLLKGLIPPAAKEGDRFDVEVGTMKSTEATSIENGMVGKTRMGPFEIMNKRGVRGNFNSACSGRILVDSLFESRKDQSNLLHGHILGGGVVMEARELGLMLGAEDVSTRTALSISRAINSRLTYADNSGRHGIATPKTDKFVTIVVPDEYKNNLGRFFDIIGNIMHSETQSQRLERIEKLEKSMSVPAEAELAAFRLEAIGANGIPILKRALKSDRTDIKFYAAEALAYQGEVDGMAHLRYIAEKEPALRWPALTALSTLADSDATRILEELMHVNSAETRYGAFQAMLAQSPNHSLAQGHRVGDFYLHRIESGTDQPMLHFSRRKRPEIVVFGDQQTVSEEFLHVEPNLTIQGTKNGNVSITRHSVKGDQRMVVTNKVVDLIEAFSQAGFTYGDQLKIFTQAKNGGTLNSRLVVNAMPKLGRTYIHGQFADESDSTHSAVSNADLNDYDDTGADSSQTTSVSRWKNWFTR